MIAKGYCEWGLNGIRWLADHVSIDAGFAGDVELAVELGASECAPLLVNGAYLA